MAYLKHLHSIRDESDAKLHKDSNFFDKNKKNTPLQYPHMQTKKELRERELIHIYSIVKGKQERARERERETFRICCQYLEEQ